MRRKELTDFPFDKEVFKEVIIKARGDRSQAEFCQDTGLSYAYLNKYANGKLSDAPTGLQTSWKLQKKELNPYLLRNPYKREGSLQS